MAPVIQQTSPRGDTSGGDSQAASFSSLPTAGRCVIVTVWAWNNTDPLSSGISVTDNQSNTYSFAVVGPIQTGMMTGIWYCPVIGTPSGTYTVTVNGIGVSDALSVVLLEVSGAASSPLGATAGTVLANANPHVGSSVVTTVADSLMLALCCDDHGGSSTYTVGSSFLLVSTQPDNTSFQSGHTGSRIVTSTGTYNCSWTMSTAGQATQCIAVFKGVSAATKAPPIFHRPWRIWRARSVR